MFAMSRKQSITRVRLQLTECESRIVPAAFPIPASAVAISPDDGGIPIVKLVDPTTGEDFGEVQAYEDAFRGGVHTALGDVNGDGVRDLVIAPGSGGGPRIRVVDGKTGQTLNDFFVYEPQFTGGIFVTLGDTNGDGRADIITGTGNGGGPRVRVLDGKTLGATTLKDFFAYEDSFRGGVQVAAGDTNGDGRDDIITGTGVGGGPRVQVFSGKDNQVLRNYFAYEDSFRGGVLVAAGDVNGDGKDDIITGTGPGGGPVVRVVSGLDGHELSTILTDDPTFRGGVRVEARDLNGDGRDDVIAHLRHGNDDGLRAFDGTTNKFLSSVSRVIDDNPSPKDALAGKTSGVTTGVASHIEGKLLTVNASANSVTVQLQNGTSVTVQAGAGTEIKRDKANTTLASFQAGDKVEALIGPDGIAWELESKSAAFVEGRTGKGNSGNSGTPAVSLEGSVTAIDTAASTVSIRDQAGIVTVVHTGTGTVIERNGVKATLATFVVGDHSEAKIATNGIAVKLEAQAVSTLPPAVPPTVPPPATGTSNPPANSKLEGTITAVDVAANSVTIAVQNGTKFVVRAVISTKIERNGVHTTLTAFQVGDFGEAVIGGDGFATKIQGTRV